MSTEKAFLRRKLGIIRDAAKNEDKDKKIFKSVIACQEYKSADVILIYYSVRSEVDTLKIIDNALKNGKKVALPKCTDVSGEMVFYLINDMQKSLVNGKFSLIEPDISLCEKVIITEKTLCIVPALSFDKSGNRLGYGGGYYDRYFIGFKGKDVGLCYEDCLCDDLPCGEHDIKVNMIVTDKRIYNFK